MNKTGMMKIAGRVADELGLTSEGWVFEIKVVPKLDSVAAINWEPSRRFATIRILPHRRILFDLGTNELRQYAVAFTLTHELLHIRFEGHANSRGSAKLGAAYEWAIDRTARALVLGMISRGVIDEETPPK